MDEYCEPIFVAPGCGGDGICIKPPQQCGSETTMLVCGCNNVTYCSGCEAAKAASGIASLGPCEGQPLPSCRSPICPDGQVCVPRGCGGEPCECSSVCDSPSEPEQPQCGCDGYTYFNECARIAAGVGLQHEGPCGVTALCVAVEGCCFRDSDCTADQRCVGAICDGAAREQQPGNCVATGVLPAPSRCWTNEDCASSGTGSFCEGIALCECPAPADCTPAPGYCRS
jgi:hypothetical protein